MTVPKAPHRGRPPAARVMLASIALINRLIKEAENQAGGGERATRTAQNLRNLMAQASDEAFDLYLRAHNSQIPD